MLEGSHITKHREHLIEGVKPIIACVGTYKDYSEGDPEDQWFEKFKTGTANLTDVDWHFSDSHRGGAVASPIDSSYKKTEGLADCTSLVVSGVDKETGLNISFLTHQDPKQFLNDNSNLKTEFVEYLRSLLIELWKRCKPGTIDAVLVGGRYKDGKTFFGVYFRKQDYIDSLKLVGAEVKTALGFEPQVINGPNLSYQDEIYYDNDNRRLYFLRPKVTQVQNSPDRDFLPADFPTSDVDKYKDRWE